VRERGVAVRQAARDPNAPENLLRKWVFLFFVGRDPPKAEFDVCSFTNPQSRVGHAPSTVLADLDHDSRCGDNLCHVAGREANDPNEPEGNRSSDHSHSDLAKGWDG